VRRYNASLSLELGEGSDTHGIVGEKLVVNYRKGENFDYDTKIIKHGMDVDVYDLDQILKDD